MGRSRSCRWWCVLLVKCFCLVQPNLALSGPPASTMADSAATREAVDAARSETDYLVFAALEDQGTIDPLSGHFRLVVEDLSAAGGPTEVRLVRSLVSPGILPAATQSLLGDGWRWNWECQLVEADRGIWVVDGGVLRRFEPLEGTPPGRFRSADGESLALETASASLSRLDGTTDVFDENGRLRTRTTRNTSVSLTYDSAGRLAKVETPDSGFLEFQYVDEQAIRVVNAVGDAATYRLRDQRLVRVEPPSGVATDYDYHDSGRLRRIVHPAFGVLQLEYDALARLTARRWQDGSVEQLTYEEDRSVRHVNRDGAVTVTRLDPDGQTAHVTDPTGRQFRLRFDWLGRLVQAADAQGAGSAFSHDERGRLTEVTGPGQQVVRLGYHADGSVPARLTSSSGTDYALEHDDQGRLVRARAGCLGETSFEYGPSGRVTAIQSSYAPGMFLSYDSAGRVQEVTNAAGHRSTIEYDGRGSPVRETDWSGQATTKSYDAGGRLSSVTDPVGATIRYEYAPSGMLAARMTEAGAATRFQYTGRDVVVTDPADAKTAYRYNPTGLLSEVVSPLGHRSRYEYDPGGNLICQTNPAGGTTLVEYDDAGRAARIVEPTGAATRLSYDSAGHLLRVADEQGERERFTYDERGLLTTSQHRDGTRIEWEQGPTGPRVHSMGGPDAQAAPWIYSYDAHGNVLRIQREDRVLLRCEYDQLDRLTRQVNDRGLEIRYEYDPMGRLTAWRDSLGDAGRIEYDAVGRPVRVVSGEQTLWRYAYDRSGNLVARIDALGHAIRYQYGPAGRLVSVTTPRGERVAFTYDAEGSLATAARASAGKSTWQHDALGNVTQTTDPLGRVWRAQFDAAGRLTSATDAEQQTSSFTYDSVGQLRQRRRPNGSVVRYAYDDQGRLRSADDGQFPVRFTRDAAGREIGIEYATIKKQLTRQFDTEGRLAELTDSSGHRVRYVYDGFGRPSEIIADQDQVFHLDYDAKDRLIRLEYPNRVAGCWSYDPSGRIVSILYQDESGRIVDGRWYEYDDVGRPIQVRSRSAAVAYEYNSDDQLVSSIPQDGAPIRFQYGPGGNRESQQIGTETRDYTYDQADQIISAGTSRYEHDANGRLVRQVDEQLGTRRYAYDDEDHLVEARLPNNRTVRFGYAATGVRVSRQDDQGTTYYLTDGLQVWAELDGKLRTTTTYVYGPGLDQPLMMTRNGKHFFLHADHLNSITAVSDETGDVVQRYQYDPFGVPQEDPVDASAQPFRFTGREWDPDLRLYYFRARYYDPALGRFLSRDPVAADPADPPTQNAYVYAQNNPLTHVDPFGTEPSVRLGHEYLNKSFLPRRGWGGVVYNPSLDDYGVAIPGRQNIPQFGPRVDVQLGTSALRAGPEQILATRFHEAQHEMQAISGRWSRLGIGMPNSVGEQQAHWRTAEFAVRQGFKPELTEQYIQKFGHYGGDPGQLRAHLQSLGFQGVPAPGLQFGTALQGANAATRMAGVVGAMLGPANLVANYLENQSGSAVIQEGAVQVVGVAVGALVVKVAGMGTTALAGTTVAATAPFVAAGAAVAGVAYGVDRTSTRLGEAVVASEQRHMASTQVSQLNALLGGDYLSTNAQSIDALLALKAQIDAAHNELLISKASTEAAQRAADAGYQQLLQYKSRLSTPSDLAAADASQADTLRADANRLADSCEQLANAVVTRLAGVTAQGVNSDAAEQAQQDEQTYSECLGQLRTIHSQACQVVRQRNELVSIDSSVEVRQSILAQLGTIVAQIGQQANWAEQTSAAAQGKLQTIQQLKTQMDSKAANIRQSLARLAGIVTTPAVRDHPNRSALESQITMLQGRLASVESLAEDSPALAQDSLNAAQDARATHRAAVALLASLDDSVPQIETAEDAMARAVAAKLKAESALLRVLRRSDQIAASDRDQQDQGEVEDTSSDTSSDTVSETSSDNTGGTTHEDERSFDIKDLLEMIGLPVADEDPPGDDRQESDDEEPDVSYLFDLTGPPAEPDAMGPAGDDAPVPPTDEPSPVAPADPIAPSAVDTRSVSEYEGRYRIYLMSVETSRYEASTWLLDWRLDGEDRATATLSSMEQVGAEEVAQMRQLGLELPLQVEARRTDQYYSVQDRRLEVAVETLLKALARIDDAIGAALTGGSTDEAMANPTDTDVVILHSLRFTIIPRDGVLQLQFDVDSSLNAQRTKKTVTAIARPVDRGPP